MKRDMFYVKSRRKKAPKGQLLRGRWRTTTSKSMGRYKFVVLRNPYIIKRDWDETQYVLRKTKMQEGTNGPTATR